MVEPVDDADLIRALGEPQGNPFEEHETGDNGGGAYTAADTPDGAGMLPGTSDSDSDDGLSVDDDGGAWEYDVKKPKLQGNVTAGAFGQFAKEEYEALKAKFLARFNVDTLSDITLEMLCDLLDPSTSVIGQTLLMLLTGDGTLIPEGNTHVVFWSFLRRRFSLQALGVASSAATHPIWGRVYGPIIDGDGDVAGLDHDQYLRLLKNMDSTYHYEQHNKQPWQLFEVATNTFLTLFRVLGRCVLVVDDDKIHDEDKDGLRRIGIYVATLGDTKRWGATNHGTNSATFRFKVFVKCQRTGETVADCLLVSLLGVGDASSVAELKASAKLQGKLMLFDRAYTYFPNLVTILQAGGDGLGTFRQQAAGPFNPDRAPSSVHDKRMVLQSRGCRSMVQATCVRPDMLPNVPEDSSQILKDRLRVSAFFNGRGSLTQMWSTLSGADGMYALELHPFKKPVKSIDARVKGFFLEPECGPVALAVHERCVELLAQVELEVRCLTREQGPSPAWLLLRLTGLTGKSSVHALRVEAQRDGATPQTRATFQIINGNSGSIPADVPAVGDAVDATGLDFCPAAGMFDFAVVCNDNGTKVDVHAKINTNADYLEELGVAAVKRIFALLPLHSHFADKDPTVAAMRLMIVKWAKKYVPTDPAKQRLAALDILNKASMKTLLVHLRVHQVSVLDTACVHWCARSIPHVALFNINIQWYCTATLYYTYH